MAPLRRVVSLLFMAVIMHVAALSQKMQDVVYLKNGSIIRGIVIEQVPGQSIKIQTKDGNAFVYKMEDIERMTREDAMETADGPASSGFAVGGHIGTDVTGGIGFGGGLAYILVPAGSAFGYEFGLDFFYHGYEETDEGSTEKVNLSIFVVRSNWLWNYSHKQDQVYFVSGVGFVVAMVEWNNEYDPAVYGYSLTETEDYTSVGNVINLGVGYSTASGFGVRLETPMLFFYNTGNAASFVPTFTIGVKIIF